MKTRITKSHLIEVVINVVILELQSYNLFYIGGKDSYPSSKYNG